MGLGVGLVVVMVLLGVLALAKGVQVNGRQALPEGFAPVYTQWLIRSLLIQGMQSLIETAIVCLLFFGALRRLMPLAGAIGGAALLFGALHFGRPHFGPPLVVSVAVVVALPMLALFLRLRSFWAAAGFHFAWNVLLGSVFGVVVAGQDMFGLLDTVIHGPALWTGGAYGVEGSLPACVINGLAALLLLRAGSGRSAYMPG